MIVKIKKDICSIAVSYDTVAIYQLYRLLFRKKKVELIMSKLGWIRIRVFFMVGLDPDFSSSEGRS